MNPDTYADDVTIYDSSEEATIEKKVKRLESLIEHVPIRSHPQSPKPDHPVFIELKRLKDQVSIQRQELDVIKAYLTRPSPLGLALTGIKSLFTKGTK